MHVAGVNAMSAPRAEIMQGAALALPHAAARPDLLKGPIASTILRLSLPTAAVLVVQTLVGVAETYFVSFLGTEALAGVALVFPVLMLMQMMANGGIGGGVAAAVARAVGAGREADATALVLHALVLGVALGLVFMVVVFVGGPALYRALGGEGAALAAALDYSNAIFAGAILLWVTALLAAALRGAGNVRAPARITFVGALVLLPLSPVLIFGLGPLPALGVTGAGIAVALYYAGAAAVLLRHLLAGRASVGLARAPLQRRLFVDILGVGALSAVGTVQANLTVALVTGAAGLYGTTAIAGYGIASRLDYLLIPLLFGLGTGALTMAGAAVGAGDVVRARRVAWTAAAVGGGAVGLLGVFVALVPEAWAGIFTDDPAVLATASQYLRIVAPFYVLFGGGYMLYFASQGAGRILVPVLAGTARLAIAGFAGWLAAAAFGIGLGGLFAIVAAASVAFAFICVLAVRGRRWGTARRL
jgi:putative MATE family efflux protein